MKWNPDISETMGIIERDIESQSINNHNFGVEDTFGCDLDRYKNNALIEESLRLRNENAELELNIELKRTYARNIFLFMCIWTFISFVIIFLDSFTHTSQSKCLSFDVSDSVMITLIGGTTVSVISLVGFVVKGLFLSAKTDKDSNMDKKK